MPNGIYKNIVLIGMMGAGKSYIGGKLAKLLAHFNYVDIDEEIERQEGMIISKIFEKHSEEYFRNIETETIKKFASNNNYIISTGGGAFENPKNIQALKENGIVFYLKAHPIELFNRIKNEKTRPLLLSSNVQNVIKNLLKKREKNYLKADFVIDTDNKQAYTILDDILKEYTNHVK